MASITREAEETLTERLRAAKSKGKLPPTTKIRICSRAKKGGKQTIFFAVDATTNQRLKKLGTVEGITTICG